MVMRGSVSSRDFKKAKDLYTPRSVKMIADFQGNKYSGSGHDILVSYNTTSRNELERQIHIKVWPKYIDLVYLCCSILARDCSKEVCPKKVFPHTASDESTRKRLANLRPGKRHSKIRRLAGTLHIRGIFPLEINSNQPPANHVASAR